MPNKSISIAISRCLLGEKVRYDGTDKYCKEISDISIPNISLKVIPFCPEVQIGMGIPRLPIQLERVNNKVRARRVNNPVEDFTDALRDYAHTFCQQHSNLIAMINKKGSPSCGHKTAKFYSKKKLESTEATGVFVAEVKRLMPEIIIIDEVEFANHALREDFINTITKKAL